MKKICIIGLGRFGSHLAKTLGQMDCEVLAADIDEASVTNVRDYVHRAVICDARSFDALQSLITPDMDDVVVSLAEDLEASILCTLHLQRIGVQRIHAKAGTQDHATILKAVGATEVVFPEWRIAEQMAQRLLHPDLVDFLPISKEYRVVETLVPDEFVGKTLADLDLRRKYEIFVIAIRTGRDAIDLMPTANTALQKGHVLIMIGKENDISKVHEGF